jgi:hypothetical protein
VKKQSNMRLPILVSLLFCTLYSFAQTPVQVIKGCVQDMESHQGMAGATVAVMSVDPIVGAVTDSLGNFRIENIPVGRHVIEIRNLGYRAQRVAEVLVEAGKETILNTYMILSEEGLETITIRASKPAQIHPLSTRLITIEQTLRFPATFFDPARAAGFYPGVVNQNDQANALSIRGNSPAGLVVDAGRYRSGESEPYSKCRDFLRPDHVECRWRQYSERSNAGSFCVNYRRLSRRVWKRKIRSDGYVFPGGEFRST